MLSQTQHHQLVQILSEENATFEDSLKRFRGIFTKHEYFCAGWVVQHLIQYNVRSFLIFSDA